MIELIDRQAALEKVRAMQTYKLFVGDDMILVDKAEVQTELMMLPTIQPEPQWIPCSERMPEKGIDVLVTRKYDGREDGNKSCCYVEVASCFGQDDGVTWNSYSDEYKMHPRNHSVIAWMPLPEAYKPNK